MSDPEGETTGRRATLVLWPEAACGRDRCMVSRTGTAHTRKKTRPIPTTSSRLFITPSASTPARNTETASTGPEGSWNTADRYSGYSDPYRDTMTEASLRLAPTPAFFALAFLALAFAFQLRADESGEP